MLHLRGKQIGEAASMTSLGQSTKESVFQSGAKKNNSEILPSWESDRDAFLQQICAFQSTLKILLKTKDESSFLQRWYDHHRCIVGKKSIIILDNCSTNKCCLDFYEEIRECTPIISFQGLHNDVHDTRKFTGLYESLRASCRYFIFLDTDEFLYLHADGKLVRDSGLEEALCGKFDRIIPGSWISNIPGTDEAFQLSEASIISGLRWGKPIIRADEYPTGYINHNCQIPAEFYDRKIDARFVILHLSKLYTQQRIAVNLNKLKQRGFFQTDNHLVEVLDAEISSVKNRQIRAYLAEIQDALKNPFEDRALVEGSESLSDGQFQVRMGSGELSFNDAQQERLFKSTFSLSSPIASILNGGHMNAVDKIPSVNRSALSISPHMTPDEIELFCKSIAGSSSLLEFGSGGSTVLSAALGIPVIHSVDSDLAWLSRVAEAPEVVKCDFVAHHIDIGKLAKWGNPADKGSAIKWPRYYTDIWGQIGFEPDVVLVDGRFRVACTLMALLHCRIDTTIILHDFWSRPYYHEVLQFLDCRDRVDDIGVFKQKSTIDWKRMLGIFGKYVLDFR